MGRDEQGRQSEETEAGRDAWTGTDGRDGAGRAGATEGGGTGSSAWTDFRQTGGTGREGQGREGEVGQDTRALGRGVRAILMRAIKQHTANVRQSYIEEAKSL